MRLLIVDDDVSVRRLLCSRLEKFGVSVTAVATGAATVVELRRTEFDVMILDLTLPDGSGLDVLRDLRAGGSETHVIILSGAGTEEDRVRAIDLGADDYVVKPFFVRELVARVLAVRRRQDFTEQRMLRFGSLTIDLAARQVALGEAPVHLTIKEFDLLAFLAARPRHVFGRDELLRSVWNSTSDWQQASTVTEHMRRLRSKIEADPRRLQLLRTVRGAGYRFDAPLVEPPEPAAACSGTLVVVDEVIVSADETAVSIVGVASEAELLGRDPLGLIAPQSLVAASARRDAQAAGRSVGSQVVAVRRADGTDTFVELSSSPCEWEGSVGRQLTIRPSTDPSARLRHLVTGVFSEISDAVIVTDPHLHIRSWNQAAERLYGWDEREVLGRHLFDVAPIVDPDDRMSSAMQTLETTGRWYGESRQVTRDGSLVTVSASTTLVRDDSGEPVVVVSVNRPVPAPAEVASARRGRAR